MGMMSWLSGSKKPKKARHTKRSHRRSGKTRKPASSWKRVKAQEGGNVIRWYERPDGSIASLVKGYHSGEANLRISTKNECLPETRGHESEFLKKSDDDFKRMFSRNEKLWKSSKSMHRGQVFDDETRRWVKRRK